MAVYVEWDQVQKEGGGNRSHKGPYRARDKEEARLIVSENRRDASRAGMRLTNVRIITTRA